MQPNKYRVRYIGPDAAEIRNGEIYDAMDLMDSKTMIGVYDRSGEGYAYPKELFQILPNQYDVVRLKDGREAAIVEVFEDRAFYADVGSGPKDWDTIFVTIDDIESVIWRMPATEK